MMAGPLALALTPHGRLVLTAATGAGAAPSLDAAIAARLRAAFERGSGHGLLQLGAAAESGTLLAPVYAYWCGFGARYVAALCTQPESDAVAPPDDLDRAAAGAPPMTGAEYLTAAVLEALWRETDAAFRLELREARCGVQEFLQRHNPAWNLVGRVHFNLAENRLDAETPFAFLATYTTRLSAQSKAQHLPLGQALSEYAGAASKDRLLSLLLPVQRAAQSCPWLKETVDAGEIFHPLRWTAAEAMRLLNTVPELEAAGVVVRMPASWRGLRPPRPRVTATVGGKAPSALGQDALLDFQMNVTLDGETLTAREIRELLAQTSGLALVRGRWVEVDRDQLSRTMERFRATERAAAETGLSFAEAMRLLAGANIAGDGDAATADWSQVVAGSWLAETLDGLRRPDGLAPVDPGATLKGMLRPYQQAGVRWLYLLSRLGLGACLADDMGLGKTIQVLSLLLILKDQAHGNGEPPKPSLLVAPASLMANWASEIERFAPGLTAMIAHPSAIPPAELKSLLPERLHGVDLVIASYGTVLRLPWIADRSWRLAILDEAQAIKNPGAGQTRAVKKLTASARLALTGTPVENRLGDLWSIFDFINPGLLGTAKEFTAFAKRLEKRPGAFAPLRELVRPYILRRLKTDRKVIADLPDKTEIDAFCHLSRKQAALYQEAVREFKDRIETTEGIQRRGLVLSFLMRFKQICNHPAQWLGDGGGTWNEDDSGKLARLREIAEVIADKQEKVLVFTQFREAAAPLAAFLASVFGAPGLVLHGGTDVKSRKDLVRRFQEDEVEKFFILSLKAGGAGLNLTAASHVVHFDRWWNPAVENQATDRAFRIGQTRNVLVHKFVCRGTVEEKIDALIESKRRLSRDVLEGGAGAALTEMNNGELLRLFALDLNKALREA